MRRRLIGVLAALAAIVAVVAVNPSPAAAAWVPNAGWGYQIRDDETDKCLDVIEANPANEAPLQRFDCGLQWNQQWIFDDRAVVSKFQDRWVESWRIHPRHAMDKCLDVKGGVHPPYAPVQIFTCHNEWNQRWIVDGTASGSYVLLRAAYKPDLCLAITGWYGENGGWVETQPCWNYATLLHTRPAG